MHHVPPIRFFVFFFYLYLFHMSFYFFFRLTATESSLLKGYNASLSPAQHYLIRCWWLLPFSCAAQCFKVELNAWLVDFSLLKCEHMPIELCSLLTTAGLLLLWRSWKPTKPWVITVEGHMIFVAGRLNRQITGQLVASGMCIKIVAGFFYLFLYSLVWQKMAVRQ